MPLFVGHLKVSLELQILFINFLGLVDSILKWNWLKWDQQLEKIWNLSVLQTNEIDAKDVDWIKTILSQIVVARFIINRLSFLAYFANIYTILTQNWQNLLILWMVLSFVKDIVLEIVVIVTTFLLWHKGCFATSLFVEFIVSKTIWLVVPIGKWYKTLRWYMQLRRTAKFRTFAIIARRNLASVRVSGRVGHSLDDECLDIAIIRRGGYASLLNLDELAERPPGKASSELRITKSLTTLVTSGSRDTNGTNDYDSFANDLSVGEKSMRMLDITAEDVMDARSRIQERSYRSEQGETAKAVSNATEKEEVLAHFPLDKNGGETEDALRKRQTVVDDKKTAGDLTLRTKDTARYPSTERRTKKDDGSSRTISVDRQKETPIEGKAEVVDFSSVRNGDVTSDGANRRAKLMESREFYTALVGKERERGQRAQRATKIVQCPSSESARNMEAKPCYSLVKRMLRSNQISYRDEWLERINRERHPCHKLLARIGSSKKVERCGKHSYACQCLSRANTDDARMKSGNKCARSSDIDAMKSVERDGGKGLDRFAPTNVVARKGEPDGRGAALKCSLEYRASKRQVQISSGKPAVARNSASSARTLARPSGGGREKGPSNGAFDRRTNVRTAETTGERRSRESLCARHRPRQVAQVSHERSTVGLGTTYDNAASSRGKKNSSDARSEARERRIDELGALTAYNDLTLLNDDEREEEDFDAKARKRHDPSVEEREAIELRALRAYNRLTLLEDKKELEEARRRYDTSKEPEMPVRAWRTTYKDFTSLEDEGEIGTRYRLPSRERSTGELDALAAYGELVRSADEKRPEAGGKRDSSKRAISSRRRRVEEDNVELASPTSVPDRPPSGGVIRNIPDSSLVTRQNGGPRPNDSFLGNARHRARLSLNLREITRNIEWTLHPRGIVLANKSLQSPQGDEGTTGAVRGSLQRDIVDGDTASALHHAFYFRPEVVTRVFRRARASLGESWPDLQQSVRRRDLGAEFVCRVNNETVVRDDDTSLDLHRRLARISPVDSALFADANEARVPPAVEEEEEEEGENGTRDLCIILVEREEAPSESETAIVEDSTPVTGGSREDTRSSMENSQTTGISVLGEDQRAAARTDNATNDNLPVQLLADMLRDFGIEVLEDGGSIERIEVDGANDDDEAPRELAQPPETSRITKSPENEGGESCLSSRMKSDDGISRSRDDGSLNSGAAAGRENDASGEDVYEEAASELSSNDRASSANSSYSNEKVRPNDSYDSTYGWSDDGAETPISLEEGSLMEEFSRHTVSP